MMFTTTAGITRFIRHGHACLGVAGPAGLTLTAGGLNDSPLWSRNPSSGAGQLHTWSPWGSGKAADRLPGFNGERPDPICGSYHLGNGYRAYNPQLRRFNCPDSLSPFGAGGINPYAYCAGDPVNHTDPSGHISWQGIVGIVGGVIGLGLSLIGGLTAIAAAEGIAAAWNSVSATTLVVGGLGVAADVTGIASGSTEDVNPAASAVLGWVSMATGIVGIAISIRTNLKAETEINTAQFAAYDNNMRSRLNADEQFIYNEFRRQGLHPRYAARGARRAAGTRTRTRGEFEGAWDNFQRRNASSPRGNTNYRPNNTTPHVHYNVAREQVRIPSPSARIELDSHPLIRNIIDHPENPEAVFSAQMNKNEFNRIFLQIHPDKVPENIRHYATTATQIVQGWKSRLIIESSV